MNMRINYATQGGYSPSDGLGEGRWVPRPGSFGVQDWVGELEQPAKRCETCPTEVSTRATYCAPCKRAKNLASLRASGRVA